MITEFRYYCSCGWTGNDTDIGLYHDLTLQHRVEIAHPEIPWRTEYACGCWNSPEESHCCDRHIKGN
jgi:hypothetical protein